MTNAPRRTLNATRVAPETLRVGFVPLVHAAPLIVARELGLFGRHGVRVRLSREVGWATVREKIVGGELDAAQALAPMPLAITLGLNCLATPCVSALVMNLHGDAVVLSRDLWRAAVNGPGPLRELRRQRSDPFTLGIVYPHSSQLFLLRQWCRQVGLAPETDYRVVVVPPPQVVSHLTAGHLDGACVGEPWGSLAVRKAVGIIAATSPELAPGHPEKVLLVRENFALEREAQHAALVRALLEACRWCAQPAHHEELAVMLAGRDALSMPPDAIRPALHGRLDLGGGRTLTRDDILLFHGDDLNAPTPARMAWVARELAPDAAPALLRSVYREDLYRLFTSSAATHDEAPVHDVRTTVL